MDPTRKDGGIVEESIELKIVYYPLRNGYTVTGPHHNSTIFLAMVEMAKVNHYEFRAQAKQKAAPLITVPGVRPPRQM